MKKKILIGFICLFLVCGCKDVKLTDGKNAIVTFEEGGISSDELFSVLKSKYGASALTDLIDSYLLEKKYEETSEEKSYVNQNVKTLKEAAKEASVSLETYLQSYYNLVQHILYNEQLHVNQLS